MKYNTLVLVILAAILVATYTQNIQPKPVYRPFTP